MKAIESWKESSSYSLFMGLMCRRLLRFLSGISIPSWSCKQGFNNVVVNTQKMTGHCTTPASMKTESTTPNMRLPMRTSTAGAVAWRASLLQDCWGFCQGFQFHPDHLNKVSTKSTIVQVLWLKPLQWLLKCKEPSGSLSPPWSYWGLWKIQIRKYVPHYNCVGIEISSIPHPSVS